MAGAVGSIDVRIAGIVVLAVKVPVGFDSQRTMTLSKYTMSNSGTSRQNAV